MSAAGPGLDDGADPQARGREDVRLGAVGVVEQRDPRRPVRVVLDRGDLRRHAVLDALEVDHAVAALVAAALVARRDAAVVVPAARLLQRLGERLLRLDFVTSSKSETAMKRRPGLVGLNFLTAMA